VKITGVQIDDYGPLQGWELSQPGGFNLLFGHNETGKTLLVEAIWRFLWGRQGKIMPGTGRIDQPPRGFIRLQIAGSEVRFPDGGALDSRVELTPELCRDTFFVHNSDLSIPGEETYYNQITSRLTGLRSGEIEKIREQVRRQAGLTPGLNFKNDEGSGYLKSRLEQGQATLDQIRKLLARAEEEGWDDLERQLTELWEQIRLQEEKLKSLEQARLREKYEQGLETARQLKILQEKLQDLNNFSEEEFTDWKNLDLEQDNLLRQQKKLDEQKKEFKQKETEKKKDLEQVEIEFQKTDEVIKALEQKVLPDLRDLERQEEELQDTERTRALYRVTGMGTLGGLIVVLGGVFIRPEFNLLWLLAGGIFLGLGLFSWLQLYARARLAGRMQAGEQQIKNQLLALGISGQNRAELRRGIKEQQDRHQSWKKRRDDLREQIRVLEGQEEDREKNRLEQEETIQEIQEKIKDLARAKRVENLEQYRAKLEEKREIETEITNLKYRLQNIFQVQEEMEDWQPLLQKYEDYRDQALGEKYSLEKVESCQEELQNSQDRKTDLEKKLVHFQSELNDLERIINNDIFPGGEYILCSSGADLQAVESMLQDFIKEKKEQKKQAEIILDIFSEIREEEEEKIAAIFSDSSLTEIFQEITGGFYREVRYDRENSTIVVENREGKTLTAQQLSGGTFDQLYLAIRVALGEKILQQEPGFFVLDDPFIKADYIRLQRLLQTLQELARRGWQILYFTCKEEVLDLLRPEVEKEEVNLVRI